MHEHTSTQLGSVRLSHVRCFLTGRNNSVFIRTSVPSSAATNGCVYWFDSSVVGKDSWDLGAAWCCLRLTCDSCVLYCYFYRAILVECVAMGTGASQSCERGPVWCTGTVPAGHSPGLSGTCDCHTLGGTGNTRAMPIVPCPWCRAHGAVPTELCPWCHPGVPPSERTPTHPGLWGCWPLAPFSAIPSLARSRGPF